MSRTITVRLFDKLEITMDGITLTEAEMRSEQLVRLASLLIHNRSTGSSAQQLTDALWDGDSQDPANALKNLIYRLRKQVEKTWDHTDVILTGKGLYQLNPALPMQVDTEAFDLIISEAEKSHDPASRRALLEDAAALYRGRYLSDHAENVHILYQQNYYRDRYLDVVRHLVELYNEEKDYAAAEQLLERALMIEPEEGLLHCLLLRAYIGGNRLYKAEQHYTETMQVMGDHLSAERTLELRSIYEEMMKQQHTHETTLPEIVKELKSGQERLTAFYCEYGVFRRIYELESREKERKQESIILVLVTVVGRGADAAAGSAGALAADASGSGMNDGAEVSNGADVPEITLGRTEELAHQENEAMERVLACLMGKLRHGDIITRYSNTQYLAMLPECPVTSVDVVMGRIVNSYYQGAPENAAEVRYSYYEIE